MRGLATWRRSRIYLIYFERGRRDLQLRCSPGLNKAIIENRRLPAHAPNIHALSLRIHYWYDAGSARTDDRRRAFGGFAHARWPYFGKLRTLVLDCYRDQPR